MDVIFFLTCLFIIITFLFEAIIEYIFKPSLPTMLLVPLPLMLILGLIIRHILKGCADKSESSAFLFDVKLFCICLIGLYFSVTCLNGMMQVEKREQIDNEKKKNEILVEISNDKELIDGLDDKELYQTAINKGYTILQEDDKVVFKKNS